MIDLSCDVRISTEVFFVLSQFTRLTDRQTDVWTALRTALAGGLA